MKTTLTLSIDLLRAADRIAREMGISRDDVFRKAMERYLEQQAAVHAEATTAVRGKPSQLAPLVASTIDDDEDW